MTLALAALAAGTPDFFVDVAAILVAGAAIAFLGYRAGFVPIVGFLLAGVSTLRAGVWQDWRRVVPLATGIWSTLLVGVSMTGALAAGVGVYGVCMLLLGVALREPQKPRTTAEVVA